MNINFALGQEYFSSGKFDESLKCHKESLRLKLNSRQSEESLAQSYLEIGSLEIINANHNKAKESFNEALKLIHVLGENNETASDVYFRLAEYYNNVNDLKKAEDFNRKSLKIKLSLESLGDDHISTAASYLNLGLVLRKLNKIDESLENLEKSKKIYDTVYYDNHPQVCEINIEIGINQRMLSQYFIAEKHFSKAKALIKSWQGEDSDLADIYEKLAFVYLKIQDYKNSEKYYKESLAIYTKLHGEVSYTFNMASCTYYLGLINKINGKNIEANSHFLNALNHFNSLKSNNEPLISFCEMHIGILYAQDGKMGQANELLEKSKKKIESIKDNLLMADYYFEIAILNKRTGDFLQSENFFRKSLELRKTVLGNTHYDNALIYKNLALLYLDNNKIDSAVNNLKLALNIYDELYSPFNIFSADIAQEIGINFFYKSENNHAIFFLEKAVDAIKGLCELGSNSPQKKDKNQEEDIKLKQSQYGECLLNLGKCYLTNDQDLNRAYEKLKLAIGYFEKIFGVGHIKSKECYTQLSVVCRKLNKNEEAQKYMNK